MIVLAKQIFTLAMEQYHGEFDAGSRSNSRSQLLGEIGNHALTVAERCKYISNNIGLLGEIPMNPEDFNDPDKIRNWQIWLLRADTDTWQINEHAQFDFAKEG